MPANNEHELIDVGTLPSAPRAERASAPREQVILERDTPAVLIPSGMQTTLPAGSTVTITQELGGDFTVMTSWGYMARVNAEHADALGRQAEPSGETAADAEPFSEERVWDALRKVYDPEIPVNIVDLGLIYGMEAAPHPEGGQRVHVRMTLTAPGCGMGPVLAADVKRKVEALPGVREAEVELTFDPTWNRDMVSEAAQLELGVLGLF